MFESQVRVLNIIMEEAKAHNYNELINIEFKTNFPSEQNMWHDIWVTICAISNACTLKWLEQGYIVIGIQDGTGELVGTLLDVFNVKIWNQDFELWLRNKLGWVEFELEPFTYDWKNLMIIKISKSIGQIAKFEDIAYLRVWKHNKKLTDCDTEMQNRLHFSVRKSSFWYRQVISGNSPEEILGILDHEAYYRLVTKNIPESAGVVISDFVDEWFVRRNDDWTFAITYLGWLVLGRDLDRMDMLLDKRVRVITYSGPNKLHTPIQDRFFSKGYALSFLEIIDYLKTQIPETQLISGWLRQNVLMYPEVAIREFLGNCLVHQDFLESWINPVIEIFVDRMEFHNAWWCIVDVMRILNTVPKRRNEILVDIMRRMRVCESRASWLLRALDAIWEQKLPTPVFQNRHNSFAVVMYNHRNYDELTEEQKIMSCYYYTCYCHSIGNVRANNTSLRNLLGIKKGNYPIVSRLINRCMERGLIKEFDPSNKSRKFRSYIPHWADIQ